ncbi:MAG: hypothetical protein LBL60_00760 [Mycoplasmataceae bacterium]|jgi:hypothetical protein|nr:hypothetical protein [Mycoplasmataceae bacterium]
MVNYALIIVLTIVISLPFLVSTIAIPICRYVYKKKNLKALPIKEINRKKT